MRVQGSVVLVTGSSRGIGRAVAVEAARRGAKGVVVNYVSRRDAAEETARLVKEAGAVPLVVRADVSVYEEARKLVEAAIEKWGRLDVVVNNAGILEPKLFEDMKPRDWQRMIEVHFYGALNVAHAAIPYMKRNGGGVIVNIASVLGLRPEPEASHYSAAKAALIAWTIAVAKELADYNIRVFAVAPGGVDTDMTRAWGDMDWVEEQIPLRRLAKPEEVAKIVLDAVENPYVSGDVLTISGGLL
ncbi:SDR family NAD(P)-dependent oxidoreductase [Hyperthermus butylicus]|uniref:Short chain dehydrogenase n=1 Tax=Hyperthermus butylicus (strain DSM 5456 / JCM 9403 / PLM1-5) TaxID=415426 RepID=A2BJK2_HYPBU|nr:SDR family NAD(P)-dependent oxidoreductase [Hyperthermus butylicus]ABM80163.1 short chain dehydrogenase [Hyperthermus butylicus DSM 5456]